MSRDQRVKHLKKVNSLSVKDPSGVMFVSDLSGPSTSNIDKSAFPSVSSVVESLKPIESSLMVCTCPRLCQNGNQWKRPQWQYDL